MRLRWVLAAASILLASSCTSTPVPEPNLVAGGLASNPTPAASPSPNWTPGTVIPTVARCPEGSTPDSPSEAADVLAPDGPAAVDAQSGRLVVVSAPAWGPVEPVSFDVCTNTWQRQVWAPWTNGSWGGPALVYDPGTDALLALTTSQTRATPLRTYSTATGLWTLRTEPQRLLPWAYSVDRD